MRIKRPSMDDNLFKILKDIYGDYIWLDSSGNVIKGQNERLSIGFIQNVYSGVLPLPECRAGVLMNTESEENILYMVFYHDYLHNFGFLGGVAQVFESIALNDKIQLPQSVKYVFSDSENIEIRIRDIILNGYGEKIYNSLETFYNNTAKKIHYAYFSNDFQEK